MEYFTSSNNTSPRIQQYLTMGLMSSPRFHEYHTVLGSLWRDEKLVLLSVMESETRQVMELDTSSSVMESETSSSVMESDTSSGQGLGLGLDRG